MKFYICKHCGNIIAYVRSSGVPVVCCGEPMQEIIPGTTDGALEKHVPVIEVEGNKVTVRVGCGTPHAARALHRMDRAGDGSGQPAQAFGAGPEAGSRVYAGRGRQRCGRVRVLQPAQPVEGLKKLPFAARGSFRTPRHPKNVSRTGRYGARFLFPSLCFSPHVLAGHRRQRAARTCGNG